MKPYRHLFLFVLLIIQIDISKTDKERSTQISVTGILKKKIIKESNGVQLEIQLTQCQRVSDETSTIDIPEKPGFPPRCPSGRTLIKEHKPEPPGEPGEVGPKGDKGDTGAEGKEGKIGAPGVVAPKGDKGDIGVEGKEGKTGASGLMGPPGKKGDAGPEGKEGKMGAPGMNGPQGPKGDRGPDGKQGIAGTTGARGEKGDRGPGGKEGAPGTPGVRGEKGDRGPEGKEGPPGTTGAKGEKGDRGLEGKEGTPGPTGAKGEKGDRGLDGMEGDPEIIGVIDEKRDEKRISTLPNVTASTKTFYTPTVGLAGEETSSIELGMKANPGNSCNDFDTNGIYYIYAPSPFEIQCNQEDKTACLTPREPVEDDIIREESIPFKKINFTINDPDTLQYLYKLNEQQISHLLSISRGVSQSIRYHCLNTEINPGPDKFLQLILRNDVKAGVQDAVPIGDYSYTIGEDTCSHSTVSDEEWKFTDIYIKSNSTELLPVIGFYIRDIREAYQKAYFELRSLCFYYV